MTAPAVLVVTGLQAEARIAQGAGVTVVAGGGNPVRLAALLDRMGPEPRAVISFGIAGGLAPGLPAGTVVVADAVETTDERWAADDRWCDGLRAALPWAEFGTLAGVDRPVAGAAEKANLHGSSGALAVDMESHVAAGFARRRSLPFAALRVIADPAHRSLPQAALVGMNPDGSTNVPAVLKALARRPAELAGLLRTAFDFRAAMAALQRSRAEAGADFGFGPVSRESERNDAGLKQS